MLGFAHRNLSDPTTLSEISRLVGEISADQFLGCYAYATQSGFRVFELGMGQEFWGNTRSRWLFGIDYGRSDPRALIEVAKRENSEVRIFDGRFVVDSSGFIPRRDYHPKLALMENSLSGSHGLVLGSGNFSHNGLRRSIEAGVAASAQTDAARLQQTEPLKLVFEDLWGDACPLEDIIEDYEERLNALVSEKDQMKPQSATDTVAGFWIEAGYVTKNRGPDKPGNQIFTPNGFRRFFGLTKEQKAGTLIGEITFMTVIGSPETKNYRENDNGMEKLTLPMPEQHGFDVYDGKVLVFEPDTGGFLLHAIELGEFEMIYGHRVFNVEKLSGGRRYGELV
jgi:hypothetical protein